MKWFLTGCLLFVAGYGAYIGVTHHLTWLVVVLCVLSYLPMGVLTGKPIISVGRWIDKITKVKCRAMTVT